MLLKINYSRLKTIEGFSLLEAIIYIAILGMLFVVVVNTTLIGMDAFGKSRVKRSLATQGFTAMERMLHEIRLASSVDTIASTFGTHPGVLVLNTQVSSADETPITRTFNIVNSTLMLTEGGGTPKVLSGDVSIIKLVFYFTSSSDISEAARVEMTIESSFKTFLESRKFYSTAVLRGSY